MTSTVKVKINSDKKQKNKENKNSIFEGKIIKPI